MQNIPGYTNYKLGKDPNGLPGLLISVPGFQETTLPSRIVLENLYVMPDVVCRIFRTDGSSDDGQFIVAHCTTEDPVIQVYFLKTINTLVHAIGINPSRHEVIRALTILIEIFRSITQPPRKSIQGLWAELFLIATSRNPAKLLDAWHVLPEDLFDFSAGNTRIEVKGTAGRVRKHHFSLEQLNPPPGTTVLVASLFVERAGAGISLTDLVGRIRDRVKNRPDLLLHMDQILSLTLGKTWLRTSSDERFDYELAKSSLAFYDASLIPRIRADLPPEISQVHFIADLSNCPPTNISQDTSRNSLFEALR